MKLLKLLFECLRLRRWPVVGITDAAGRMSMRCPRCGQAAVFHTKGDDAGFTCVSCGERGEWTER
jgi:tRNA(Ile2) C34 agmatinyltransferase TiaS